jgi:tryptophan-rich sensory protein
MVESGEVVYQMNEMITYENWIRPAFAPPSEIFGIVWPILYVIIAISFGYVFYKTFKGDIPFIVALPFILNLFFNFSYTYIQFTLQSFILASIDIILVLGTIIWAMIAVYKYSKIVTYAQIPYLLWVSFATVLQFTIFYLNQ